MATNGQLLNGVDFIAFPTKDWEAAKKFYGETLGLPFGKQWGEMPADEFETGTVTIALMQVDAFNIDFSPNTTPARVPRRRLRGRQGRARIARRRVRHRRDRQRGLQAGDLHRPGRQLAGDPSSLRAGRHTGVLTLRLNRRAAASSSVSSATTRAGAALAPTIRSGKHAT